MAKHNAGQGAEQSAERDAAGRGGIARGAARREVREGYLPFSASGISVEGSGEGCGASGEGRGGTYFRVVGDLGSDKAPLVCLHGGPGSTHNYFELLDPLADDGRAVVSYDQVGCGASYVDGRPDLWRAQTWVRELEALVGHLGLSRFHLLGQSWGGMLAITYLVERRPAGALSAILSSTLSSSRLWGREQHRMARQLPEADARALEAAEKSGDYSSEAYRHAIDRYMGLHCADVSPAAGAPECLRRPKRSGEESYRVAWGPNELTPEGTLAAWDYTDRLAEIDIPALVISGTDDLCTPLVAKTMFDRLPRARWELLEGCRHMCFADDTPRYLELLRSWLSEVESGPNCPIMGNRCNR
jgi:proline iminopeptidase